MNGNHVVQRAVAVCPPALLPPLAAALLGEGVVALAQHPYGCRCVQRLLERGGSTNSQFAAAAAAAPASPGGQSSAEGPQEGSANVAPRESDVRTAATVPTTLAPESESPPGSPASWPGPSSSSPAAASPSPSSAAAGEEAARSATLAALTAAAPLLAADPFGNYVVQSALKVGAAFELRFSTLHRMCFLDYLASLLCH